MSRLDDKQRPTRVLNTQPCLFTDSKVLFPSQPFCTANVLYCLGNHFVLNHFVLLGQLLCPAWAIALSCLGNCFVLLVQGNLLAICRKFKTKTFILTASFHAWMHQQDLYRFLLQNFQMFLQLKDHFPQTKVMLSYTPTLSTSKVLS